MLNDLLTRVTYMPGTRLSVINDGDNTGRYLAVNLRAEDSYYPGSFIRLPHLFPMPDNIDAGNFLPWVADRLIDAARHESREWFRVDGVPFIDPHQAEPGSLYR